MAAPVPALRVVLLLLLLPPPPGVHGELCVHSLFLKSCPVFCCGTCYNQYCCADVLKKFVWNKEQCPTPKDSLDGSIKRIKDLASSMKIASDFDSDHMSGLDSNIKKTKELLMKIASDFDSDPKSGFGATVAIGLTVFVLFIVTIIICFTCSCCCLYKMCCQPRPVVTTTTSTTVVHTPYPQPPSVPPSYPGPTYQGYHPMPPQPGMAAAPYPTQYPPPYPAQPMGPPAYHETFAGGAAMPYTASQPPYNPAYMDSPKAAP
ncbi:protein shisa-5 isoform X1 [Loxodonta africana]|uniref:protein shisa-5 isoform X1 n=2 Tax=Loxodonta africana TaxID=9785 RepID=UPI0030D2E3AE